jgi:NAD(P)-dependent dehydrogenase (short-subunit alcohol dehydrogenase family)
MNLALPNLAMISGPVPFYRPGHTDTPMRRYIPPLPNFARIPADEQVSLAITMDLELKGKVAVITGGSVGIGLAVAEGLAAEGVSLVLAARQAERVQSEARRVSEHFKVRAIGVAADVAKVEDVGKVVSAVKQEFGGADILIDNAGTGSNETIMEAPDEKWQYYWDLHVMAAVRLARGLVPFMRQRGGGVILHNASICAVQPLWYEPIYNVTKAALMMFSKTLALEVIKDNIRVNCINPGLILTPDWIKTAKQLTADKGGDWEGHLASVAREHAPIDRFATPEELASFFVFLCSKHASYSVGSTYFVDGGMLKVV